MTAGEIIDLYTHAKHPEKQIGIIAELCDCPKEEIVELLKLNGVLEQNKGGKKLQPDSVVFQDNHKKMEIPILDRLYALLDELDKEIQQKTQKYQEVSVAIKVLSEIHTGRRKKWVRNVTIHRNKL